ncbi:hypothetical protein [Shinella sumterensis]|uniref:Uncharacterized protein n=1 Tax=Shinella sumterensis TaxID=1967501 RepID=A0AA50CNQ7_9HYPH|nr:hypothetical protein [Shinella sumterensis]WLR98646.1 hypothetical protein Q9313_06340 [Shinella sumterensis]
MTAELWAQLASGVGFFVMLSGTLWGIWWRIEGKVDKAKTEAASVAAAANALAALTRQELAEHKLHTAETYVTKAGMQEQTAQIMRAIEGVGHRIDSLGERLDRMYEHPPRPTRRAS